MADFPYVLVPGRLKDFLAHAQTAGVPDKVNTPYLEKVGFKSKNDRAIVPVLRFIDFIDASGAPTKRWMDYRNKSRSKAVIGQALAKAYADLFKTYPDAYRKDNEALRNYFSAHTKAGDRALSGIVQTFKSLADQGEFDGAATVESDDADETIDEEVVAEVARVARRSNSGVVINLNVQVTVPESEKPEVYDNFFAAMKKHLLT